MNVRAHIFTIHILLLIIPPPHTPWYLWACSPLMLPVFSRLFCACVLRGEKDLVQSGRGKDTGQHFFFFVNWFCIHCTCWCEGRVGEAWETSTKLTLFLPSNWSASRLYLPFPSLTLILHLDSLSLLSVFMWLSDHVISTEVGADRERWDYKIKWGRKTIMRFQTWNVIKLTDVCGAKPFEWTQCGQNGERGVREGKGQIQKAYNGNLIFVWPRVSDTII